MRIRAMLTALAELVLLFAIVPALLVYAAQVPNEEVKTAMVTAAELLGVIGIVKAFDSVYSAFTDEPPLLSWYNLAIPAFGLVLVYLIGLAIYLWG